jgi:nucleotide-binding universal stress UspA family protein
MREPRELPGDTPSIVVGVDDSAGAAAALRWAAAEARLRGAALTVVHAYYRPAAYWGTTPDATDGEPERRHARQVLDAALHRAVDDLADLPVRGVLHAGRAARGLIEAAAEADLLVLGTRGAGGFEGLLLGSTAEHGARHASCTVVLVPALAGAGAGRILVGVDGSPHACAALAWAVGEAELRDAQIDVLSVFEPYREHRPWGAEFMDVASPGWRHRLHRAAEQRAADSIAALPSPSAVPIQVTVEAGHPAKALATRSQKSDLVVVGARGQEGFHGLLLGSVTRQLLHHSACPVAVVRGPETAADEPRGHG